LIRPSTLGLFGYENPEVLEHNVCCKIQSVLEALKLPKNRCHVVLFQLLMTFLYTSKQSGNNHFCSKYEVGLESDNNNRDFC
jgi:hypothetical protein